jgi:hypothetical protein
MPACSVRCVGNQLPCTWVQFPGRAFNGVSFRFWGYITADLVRPRALIPHGFPGLTNGRQHVHIPTCTNSKSYSASLSVACALSFSAASPSPLPPPHPPPPHVHGCACQISQMKAVSFRISRGNRAASFRISRGNGAASVRIVRGNRVLACERTGIGICQSSLAKPFAINMSPMAAPLEQPFLPTPR